MTAAIEQERSGRSRPTSTPRLSHDERVARGRRARSDVPRSTHAGWTAPDDRPDPVGLLEEQAASRVPELVPIRHGRMIASPLAFPRRGLSHGIRPRRDAPDGDPGPVVR
jgi:hypothetical protein